MTCEVKLWFDGDISIKQGESEIWIIGIDELDKVIKELETMREYVSKQYGGEEE